jgi:hypothetical protein
LENLTRVYRIDLSLSIDHRDLPELAQALFTSDRAAVKRHRAVCAVHLLVSSLHRFGGQLADWKSVRAAVVEHQDLLGNAVFVGDEPQYAFCDIRVPSGCLAFGRPVSEWRQSPPRISQSRTFCETTRKSTVFTN